MIHFKKLIAEGAGSLIEKTEFILDRPGINLMRGHTGSGKTTIPSILTWVLFGKSLKEKASIQTWEHLRPEDFKGTMGQVEFDKDGKTYTIIRCISYKRNVLEKTKGGSNLFILEDGVLYSKERNKQDRQAYINKVLGYSYELFVNSIIFGQKMKRIIEETGPNKKQLFEEAFEVTFIENAKKKTEVDRNKTTDALREITDDYESIQTQLEDAIESYDDALEFEQSFEKTKKENIKKLQDKTQKLLSKKISLDKDIKKLSKLKNGDVSKKIDKVKEQISEVENLKKKLDKLSGELERSSIIVDEDKSQLQILKKEKCPYCKQPVKGKELKKLTKELNERISEYLNESVLIQDNIEKIEKNLESTPKLKKLKSELEVLQGEAGKIKERNKRLSNLEREADDYQEDLDNFNKDIKEVEKEKLKIKSTKYLDKVSKLKKKKKKARAEIKVLEKQEEIYTWLIKDPLSNNGLKAYVFDSLLGRVNDKLFDYAQALGFQVEFGIDLESSRKDFYQVIYQDDNVIMYPDLSGGQKQLVDFAVGYAIYQVISSIKPNNLNFFDEPFEGLDVDSIDIISDLINLDSRDKSLYIISHHTSFNPVTSNIIYFKLNPDKSTNIN